MKLTRDAAFKLNKALTELDSKKYSKYFLLAITTAKKTLSTIVEDIDTHAKNISFKEYDDVARERFEILKKYSDKNEDGTPKVVNDRIYISDENKEACQKEINELFEKNKEVLDKFDANSREFDKYIIEEIEVDLIKVSFKYIPDELEESVYLTLSVFIKETPEEIIG
jgi:transcriptional regulator of heat shock response